MGGTAPYCPFCHKLCAGGQGLKDHIKIKHPDQYQQWIIGRLPYWRYDENGELKS